jgi:short-subunit dehydrogenase
MVASVLVTGASTGLGRELALCAARDRCQLVLLARDVERLRAVAAEALALGAPAAEVLPGDLSRREAPSEIVAELERRGLAIDTLVNNAGLGVHGPFAENDLAAELGAIQVDLVALVELTRRLLPPMLAARRGRVLNVASTAAFQPGPYMATYYAAKAFVLSFSEALAAELAGSGVTVTCLCPGPTATEFQGRAGLDELGLFRSRLLRLAPAESVARAGWRGMLRGSRLVVPGLGNKLGVQVQRLMPRRLAPAVVARLQRK